MHLFIFDLNGTLVKKQPGGRPATIRPFCQELLQQVLEWQEQGSCRVAIWTTITEKNAKVIINQILTPEQQDKFLFIWWSDRCTPHPDLPFKSYKDLEKAWALFPSFDASNTTLFDDSDFKALKQPENIYKVETFVPQNKNDNELLKIKDFIQQSILTK